MQSRSGMRLFSQILLCGFRTCPACGSYSVRPSLLCLFCEEALLEIAKPRTETLGPWTVRSLFLWNPGESDRLSSLLVSLKGPCRREAWDFWAGVFARHHASFLPAGSVQSVAAPRRRKARRQDHAFHWTEALSREYGLSFHGAPFEKAASESQRRKRGLERDRGPSLVKFTEVNTDQTGVWIMGDDILTTGMTARSVHRALGRPLPFEIWCLARRSLREK